MDLPRAIARLPSEREKHLETHDHNGQLFSVWDWRSDNRFLISNNLKSGASYKYSSLFDRSVELIFLVAVDKPHRQAKETLSVASSAIQHRNVCFLYQRTAQRDLGVWRSSEYAAFI